MTNLTLKSSEQTVEEFVQDVILKGNLQNAAKYIDANVVVNSLVGIKGKGIEKSLEALTMWTEAFDIIENTLLFSTVSDDRVVNHWEVRALHTGKLLNVEASQREVTFTGVTMYEVKEGKIIAIWGYSDFPYSTN